MSGLKPWVFAWLLASLLHCPVVAKTISVDGDPVDWTLSAPISSNLAHIVRDASGEGEFIWRDVQSDARTDFFSPESDAEMREFRVTGDAGTLYFLVELSDITQVSGSGSVQVQIGLDMDQVPGSGQAVFAGLSDTGLTADAAWEYLLVTRLGSGNAVPHLFDTGFTPAPLGNAAVSDTHDVIEIALPWTALGLSGPPAGPVRLSVAVFRSDISDQTLDIAASSDALDVVANNDFPGANLPTTNEMGDDSLDYFVDVWFESDGDPMSPLHITAFEPVPGTFNAAEWIEVYNRSGQSIDLTSFATGDEETPGATEGMYRFPAGAAISPGEFLVVTRDAFVFELGNGFDADFEMDATSVTVPDMTPDVVWATGAFILDDDIDEVMLLDPQRTVLDSMAYGAPRLPGVGFLTDPTPGQIQYRTPVDRDRNMADDFRLVAVDLSISLTNNTTLLRDGETTTYQVQVSNQGPDDAIGGELVADLISALIITDSQCTASDPGTSCTPLDTGSGTGGFDLPVGTSVSFTLTATVNIAEDIFARLTLRAAPDATAGDRFASDNVAVESDGIQADDIFSDSFESVL
ncbi:MAG: lamin tail domain-containing protein [Xanthomonadales bacterium]|nr:lamin tail domain-containing protein [Xanthomonadales bacterium]